MTRLLTEWRAIWKIAGPLLVSQLCYTGMVVDALVAVGGSHGSGRRGCRRWPVVAHGAVFDRTGLRHNPIGSQATGQNNLAKAQSWIGQSMTLMLAVGVLHAVLVTSIAQPALTWFGADLEPVQRASII